MDNLLKGNNANCLLLVSIIFHCMSSMRQMRVTENAPCVQSLVEARRDSPCSAKATDGVPRV